MATSTTGGSTQSLRGKLGVIEEGALADLLVVDGKPDIDPVAKTDGNFMVIMKNGRIHNDTLPA
jgi:imidazolonepropionase-like amidohydrolase